MTDTEHSTDESQSFEYRRGEQETLVEAILNAVGAVTDTRLTPSSADHVATGSGSEQIPPLHDVIDADALTALFPESADDPSRMISFSYHGCTVTVTGTDVVLVEPQPPAETDGD